MRATTHRPPPPPPQQRPHINASTMTLRDYFAASAPKAPDWFKHKPTRPCPNAPRAEDSDSAEALAMRADRAAWVLEQQELKFFAWRWYYADRMMASWSAA